MEFIPVPVCKVKTDFSRQVFAQPRKKHIRDVLMISLSVHSDSIPPSLHEERSPPEEKETVQDHE
jgi:hypothetical protein